MSLDGTCLDVADTPHNAEVFGVTDVELAALKSEGVV